MEIGDELVFVYAVKESDLACQISHDPQDTFPDVLATARMVALMEMAAARLMKPLLSDHELSVGVGINVKHLAATPMGASVRVAATYVGQEGKLLAFEVSISDGAGVAGTGHHTRAIVDQRRLLDGAHGRQQ